MSISYFLGANSAGGFYSLYDELKENGKGYLHIIKGGAGSGKSTFMRRIGECIAAHGYEAEYVRCSGDINSIDAVFFPQLHTAYVDGTAPHVMEPELFGVNGDYINLGKFSEVPFSAGDRLELEYLQREYRTLYKYAYNLLSRTNAIKHNTETEDISLQPVKKQIYEIVNSISAPKYKGAYERKRFVSAICADGRICDLSSFENINTVYSIDNTGKAAANTLKYAFECLVEKEYDAIKCLSPLDLSCEAVISRSAATAFISSDMRYPKSVKIIETDKARSESEKKEKCTDILVAEACMILRDASALHEKIESIGKQYIDFNGLNCFTGEYLSEINNIYSKKMNNIYSKKGLEIEKNK